MENGVGIKILQREGTVTAMTSYEVIGKRLTLRFPRAGLTRIHASM